MTNDWGLFWKRYSLHWQAIVSPKFLESQWSFILGRREYHLSFPAITWKLQRSKDTISETINNIIYHIQQLHERYVAMDYAIYYGA